MPVASQIVKGIQNPIHSVGRQPTIEPPLDHSKKLFKLISHNIPVCLFTYSPGSFETDDQTITQVPTTTEAKKGYPKLVFVVSLY